MKMLSVSEAARLCGKDRGTLYRWIDKGKLSVTRGPDGERKIDPAELFRVCPVEEPQQLVNKVQHNTTTEPQDELVQVLKEQISDLKQQLSVKDEQLSQALEVANNVKHLGFEKSKRSRVMGLVEKVLP